MSVRWSGPDDPAWLGSPPDLAVVDLQVLRQVGVPEPVLLLAVRDPGSLDPVSARRPLLGGSGVGIPFDDVDELDDPLADYDRHDCVPRGRW